MEENYYTKWIKDSFYPSSIVYATDLAAEIIGKNNLTPSEFLRPFGVFKEIKYIPNEKFGTTIKNFRMDFYDSYSYRRLNQNQLQLLTDNLLSNSPYSPDWKLPVNQSSKSYIEEMSKKLKNYSFQWFNEYEKLFLEFTKFNEYTIIWDKKYITIYVDDLEIYKIDISPDSLIAFHYPFYINLNVLVGGNTVDYSVDKSSLPAEMIVDYIKVYQYELNNTINNKIIDDTSNYYIKIKLNAFTMLLLILM